MFSLTKQFTDMGELYKYFLPPAWWFLIWWSAFGAGIKGHKSYLKALLLTHASDRNQKPFFERTYNLMYQFISFSPTEINKYIVLVFTNSLQNIFVFLQEPHICIACRAHIFLVVPVLNIKLFSLQLESNESSYRLVHFINIRKLAHLQYIGCKVLYLVNYMTSCFPESYMKFLNSLVYLMMYMMNTVIGKRNWKVI